jgi:hypothetical protein
LLSKVERDLFLDSVNGELISTGTSLLAVVVRLMERPVLESLLDNIHAEDLVKEFPNELTHAQRLLLKQKLQIITIYASILASQPTVDLTVSKSDGASMINKLGNSSSSDEFLHALAFSRPNKPLVRRILQLIFAVPEIAAVVECLAQSPADERLLSTNPAVKTAAVLINSSAEFVVDSIYSLLMVLCR